MKPVAGLLFCFLLGWILLRDWTGENAEPNWKGSGTGRIQPRGSVDIDTFGGSSSRLDRFTGTGSHVLNLHDSSFVGQGTWTAVNGDTLEVTYDGQIFLTDDPGLPFGFDAMLLADGGTGWFAGAHGHAIMTGAFNEVSGELVFEFEGTLQLAGE